jgi:hypothetical protein
MRIGTAAGHEEGVIMHIGDCWPGNSIGVFGARSHPKHRYVLPSGATI